MLQCFRDVGGLVLLVLSGVFFTSNLIFSKLIKAWGWPFFRIYGTSAFCLVFCVISGVLVTQGKSGITCRRHEIKWVILRGTLGTGSFVFSALALLCGAGVGDVGALSSVNTVVAALCGRLFLGEALGALHVAAVSFSVVGAIFIADPAEILPRLATEGLSAILGLSLALLAGMSQGMMFIAVRRTGSASPFLLTVSAMGQRCLSCWGLVLVGVIDDGTLERVQASPEGALAFMALLMCTTFGTTIMGTAGAKISPAAVSATTLTAVSMVMGYGSQVVVFGHTPKLLTLVGALFMFLSVTAMALARLPSPERSDLERLPETRPMEAKESLARFIATEFAEHERAPVEGDGFTPVVAMPTLRLRHLGPTGGESAEPGAEAARIGAAQL